MEKVFFKNSKGQKIAGLLDIPENLTDIPLVLCLHGFGSRKEENQEWADILNPLGIATLRIDFTGSGESDGLFEEKTLSGFLDDAESALTFIKQLHNIDQRKIGVAGFSMGAVVSILLAAKRKEISSLVATCPSIRVSEVIKSLYDPGDFTKIRVQGSVELTTAGLRQKLNYTFFTDAEKYSITKIAQNISYEFLVIAGEKDTIVPIKQIEDFSKSTPHAKLINLKKSDHDLEQDWPQAENAIQDWFENWIKEKR